MAEVYLCTCGTHLLPYWQHHRLSEITIAAVEEFRQFKVNERDRMVAARGRGEEIPHRPLSNETINKLLVRLGQVLDAAEERELIARNPMCVNTRNRKLKVNRPQRSYLDSARQITVLLDAASDVDAAARSDHRHLPRRAMLAVLVFAGMRLGELLSLRWCCVDLADGWLYVGRSKTDAGVRRIKIRPALRDVLLELKANPDTSTGPDALVFSTVTGKQHSPSNVRRMMRNVVERANERLLEAGEAPLPRLTPPNSLRRTFASVMFALNVSLPDVMADGGWADSKTPLTVYGHAMRRDEGENDRLRVLVGAAALQLGGLGETTSARLARGVDSDHGQRAEVEGWLARPEA